ncbi:MAG: helix-turn-helix transcriptional regulator [Acidobacteria bacterium]|jgi:PadR family transcriptional regulator, regulatory protein PadR|nr:helix-turn-helix transcriptional regulator [Acidobacteriota bacterium]
MTAKRLGPPSVGEFEHLLLLAVLQCQQDDTDAYTVPIRQLLTDRTGRTVARGAVHTSLDRLEAKGLVTSTKGDPLAIRGGRARRYYTVTPLGLKAVRHAQAAVMTLSVGLDTLLEPRRS